MVKIKQKVIAILLSVSLLISSMGLFTRPVTAAVSSQYNPYQFEPMNLLNQLPTIGQDVPKVMNPFD